MLVYQRVIVPGIFTTFSHKPTSQIVDKISHSIPSLSSQSPGWNTVKSHLCPIYSQHGDIRDLSHEKYLWTIPHFQVEHSFPKPISIHLALYFQGIPKSNGIQWSSFSKDIQWYPLVIQHSYWKSPCYLWENPLFLWSFSIATLNYQRVRGLFKYTHDGWNSIKIIKWDDQKPWPEGISNGKKNNLSEPWTNPWTVTKALPASNSRASWQASNPRRLPCWPRRGPSDFEANYPRLVSGLVHPSDWCGLTLQKSHL